MTHSRIEGFRINTDTRMIELVTVIMREAISLDQLDSCIIHLINRTYLVFIDIYDWINVAIWPTAFLLPLTLPSLLILSSAALGFFFAAILVRVPYISKIDENHFMDKYFMCSVLIVMFLFKTWDDHVFGTCVLWWTASKSIHTIWMIVKLLMIAFERRKKRVKQNQ